MIFVGGGVLVLSGCTTAINLGLGTQIGTGMMIGLGGGTMTATGLSQEVSSGVDFTTGSGILNWNGAGSAVYVGHTESRSLGVASAYSIGGSVATGAGDMVLIGAASATQFALAAVTLVGGNWFLGAGTLVQIGCPFTLNVGLLWAVLIGIDSFVGAGTAVISASPAQIWTSKASWLNPGASLYFVNGAKVNPTITSFKIGKNGTVTPLKHAKNKTRLLEAGEMMAVPAVASLQILQGTDAVDPGKPNAMLQKLEGSALGQNMQHVDPVYAVVNGDGTTCNTCGFKGDVASEFVGEAAGACSAVEGAGGACSLASVQVTRPDGTKGPMPAWMLKVAGQFDESTKKTTLLDTDLVTTVFKVGCSPADKTTALTGCVDATAVAEAIKASLPTDCARVNLNAKNAAYHPEIETVDNFAEKISGSAHTDVYDLTFTSHDKACTAQVTEWVKGFAPEEFLGTLDAPADVTLEATDVALNTVHSVKGMNMASAAKEVLANMVAAVGDTGLPTVLVQGTDGGNAMSRLALPQVASGSTANVALANFFDDKPVTMELTTKCLAAATKDTALALGSFAPADQLAVPIPAGTSPGTYSLRATQNGLSWCSQPVDVY